MQTRDNKPQRMENAPSAAHATIALGRGVGQNAQTTRMKSLMDASAQTQALAQRQRFVDTSPHTVNQMKKIESFGLKNPTLNSAPLQRFVTCGANVTKHAREVGVEEYDNAVAAGDFEEIKRLNEVYLRIAAAQDENMKYFINHAAAKISIGQGMHSNDAEGVDYDVCLKIELTRTELRWIETVIANSAKRGPAQKPNRWQP